MNGAVNVSDDNLVAGGELGGELGPGWSHSLAVSTPWSEELNESGLVSADLSVEVVSGQVDGSDGGNEGGGDDKSLEHFVIKVNLRGRAVEGKIK